MTRRRAVRCGVLALGLVAASQAVTFGTGPTFRPDWTFTASNLDGWTVVGAAEWQVQNGEIRGTPKTTAGGWLVLDGWLQDVGFFTNVFCAPGCKSGVLLRAEKTATGMKGVFVPFDEADQRAYALEIDTQGREISRQPLGPAPPGVSASGAMRRAPLNGPVVGGTAAGPLVVAGGAVAAGPPAPTPPRPVPVPAGVTIPPALANIVPTYRADQWNEMDVILYENRLRRRINAAISPAGEMGVPDEAGRYGPIALYVGGTAPVRYKSVAYSDLNLRPTPAESISKSFRMQRLNDFYYSWSAAVADVNRDGIQDVLSGPFYYLGPEYTVGHQIYPAYTYDPSTMYVLESMVNLAHDFTGDGWPDLLVMSGSAGNGVGNLFVNPKGESRRWDRFTVIAPIGNEETILKDIDGDGTPEVIHAGENTLRYSKPDPSNPTGAWTTRTISEPGPWGVNIGHGVGAGDINGDGRVDMLSAYGWWEQPASADRALWTYHPQAFGRRGASQGGAGGAELGVFDVNGDGLNDVVTALEGHGFGLGWYEQKRSGQTISFVEHIIMDNFVTKNAGDVTFTEPHAAAFADIDGDGVTDLITGKRYMSHLATHSDPDAFGPAVLYVYRVVRNPKAPGGAEFVPELVHNRSGVGSHFAVADVNGDRTPDIVTATASGTFVFFNNIRAALKSQ